MTKIKDCRLAVIDVESTGIDTASDRVVEIGAALLESGAWQRRRSRVNPGVPIPKEASAVHGISDEAVAGCPPFSEVWPRVLSLIAGRQVSGYNVLSYDLLMLAAEAERHGCQVLSADGVLDVMVFVNWHERGKSRKLGDVAERYGIYPFGGAAHNAAVDCQMTGDLLLAMAARGLIPDDWDLALQEQRRLRSVVDDEYRRWGNFIYRDRGNNRLRIGAGKHRGLLLTEVPKSYLQFCLQKFTDLTADTVVAFKAAVEGKIGAEFQEQLTGIPVEKPQEKVDDDEVRR
jgi:DNA polymerase-3 subunit epsilon